MSVFDTEQKIDLNLETKEPIKVKIEVGEKFVLFVSVLAVTFLLWKKKK